MRNQERRISVIAILTIYTLMSGCWPPCGGFKNGQRAVEFSMISLVAQDENRNIKNEYNPADSGFINIELSAIIIGNIIHKKHIFEFDGNLVACPPSRVFSRLKSPLDSFKIIADTTFGKFKKDDDVSTLFYVSNGGTNGNSTLEDYTKLRLTYSGIFESDLSCNFYIMLSPALTFKGQSLVHAELVTTMGEKIKSSSLIVRVN